MQTNELSASDLKLTAAAHQKMAELINDVDADIAGIRIFSQAGGCSGMSFGMTFAEKLENSDLIRDNDGVKVIVESDTIEHLRGAEIDFTDNNGQPSFVFNNVPEPKSAGGCGTCPSSQGGGCA